MRMQVAVAELAGRLHPAKQVEVEVVSTGAAVQDKGKDGDERNDGQNDVRSAVVRHGVRVSQGLLEGRIVAQADASGKNQRNI